MQALGPQGFDASQVMDDGMHVDELFDRVRNGDGAAVQALFDMVYCQLRSMARRQLAGQSDALGATSLVNEVYLKLFRTGRGDWEDRVHFLATAARAMRQVVVDRIRRTTAIKRTGKLVPVENILASKEADGVDILALDEALRRLAAVDPQLAQVVEMRYFACYSIADTARILGVSPRTVVRCWAMARAWLARELENG